MESKSIKCGKIFSSQKATIKVFIPIFILFTMAVFNPGIVRAEGQDMNNFTGAYGNGWDSDCSVCHPNYNLNQIFSIINVVWSSTRECLP